MKILRATHTDYQHPKHLRVETDVSHKCWGAVVGFYESRYICLAPSHSQYARLAKGNLPAWTVADSRGETEERLASQGRYIVRDEE